MVYKCVNYFLKKLKVPNTYKVDPPRVRVKFKGLRRRAEIQTS